MRMEITNYATGSSFHWFWDIATRDVAFDRVSLTIGVVLGVLFASLLAWDYIRTARQTRLAYFSILKARNDAQAQFRDMRDAAEMLWVCLASADWTKQTEE